MKSIISLYQYKVQGIQRIGNKIRTARKGATDKLLRASGYFSVYCLKA